MDFYRLPASKFFAADFIRSNGVEKDGVGDHNYLGKWLHGITLKLYESPIILQLTTILADVGLHEAVHKFCDEGADFPGQISCYSPADDHDTKEDKVDTIVDSCKSAN